MNAPPCSPLSSWGITISIMVLASLDAAGTSAPSKDCLDWPQLAHDPGRTAHAAEGIPPPYRARWIWCGPDRVLRNKASDSAWPDDLAVGTKAGFNYPMPEQVPFTFAGRAQPVVVNGKVFIGDMDGRVYCLSLDDGRTLWIGENPGGTCTALAVAGNVVVATAIPGGVTGLDA